LTRCHWKVLAGVRPSLNPLPHPFEAAAAPIAISRQGSGSSLQSHDDILKTLERIADLHQKGILSDDEFKSKKAELLSRL
jgi:hypothetical protein